MLFFSESTLEAVMLSGFALCHVTGRGLSEGDGYLLSVVEGDPGICGLQSFYYVNIWLHRVRKREKNKTYCHSFAY